MLRCSTSLATRSRIRALRACTTCQYIRYKRMNDQADSGRSIFDQSGLPECNYALEEAKDIPTSRFQQLVAQDDFGGTAVTMPLKVEVS